MKRFIPYISFACLTGFTATISLPVMAGGCNRLMNEKVEINCPEDDKECQIEKAEEFELNTIVRS